jgi:hypothetical protein
MKKSGGHGFPTNIDVDAACVAVYKYPFIEFWFYCFYRSMSMNKKFGVVIGLASVLLLGACSDQKSPSVAPAVPPIAAVAVDVKVAQWGPNTTVAGKGFAQQANGNSALWFEQKGIASPDSVEVWFGTSKLESLIITPDIVGTVEVPAELLKTAGKYPVYLVVKANGKRVEIGEFEVTAN